MYSISGENLDLVIFGLPDPVLFSHHIKILPVTTYILNLIIFIFIHILISLLYFYMLCLPNVIHIYVFLCLQNILYVQE